MAEVRLSKHIGECLFTPSDVTKAMQRLEQKKEKDELERASLAKAEADELQPGSTRKTGSLCWPTSGTRRAEGGGFDI